MGKLLLVKYLSTYISKKKIFNEDLILLKIYLMIKKNSQKKIYSILDRPLIIILLLLLKKNSNNLQENILIRRMIVISLAKILVVFNLARIR